MLPPPLMELPVSGCNGAEETELSETEKQAGKLGFLLKFLRFCLLERGSLVAEERLVMGFLILVELKLRLAIDGVLK